MTVLGHAGRTAAALDDAIPKAHSHEPDPGDRRRIYGRERRHRRCRRRSRPSNGRDVCMQPRTPPSRQRTAANCCDPRSRPARESAPLSRGYAQASTRPDGSSSTGRASTAPRWPHRPPIPSRGNKNNGAPRGDDTERPRSRTRSNTLHARLKGTLRCRPHQYRGGRSEPLGRRSEFGDRDFAASVGPVDACKVRMRCEKGRKAEEIGEW